jgi:hypothetical protein
VAGNKNPFMSAILKAKYFPNNTFWTTPITSPHSIYWYSIVQVKHHLHSNAILQIHAWNLSILSSPWTDIWLTIHGHIIFPVANPPSPAMVFDLWLQGTNDWNYDLLATTFSPEAVQVIMATPIVDSQQQDILRWTPATNGKCTTKAIYSHLASLETHVLPSQGSRSISQDANSILQKAWNGKTIPPFQKTFAWCLIR